MSEALEARLVAMAKASSRLMEVLTIARTLDLPDWLVASGAIYQTVWNSLTGRDPDYGIKDYDLFYYDGSDISYEAEDIVIKRAAAIFPAAVRERVEVRNQARVHVWFERKFGEPYAPLSCSAEALTRFVSRANAVAVRLNDDGTVHVEAPFGLEDTFAMRLRPPPNRLRAASFDRIAAEMKTRWPEATIG